MEEIHPEPKKMWKKEEKSEILKKKSEPNRKLKKDLKKWSFYAKLRRKTKRKKHSPEYLQIILDPFPRHDDAGQFPAGPGAIWVRAGRGLRGKTAIHYDWPRDLPYSDPSRRRRRTPPTSRTRTASAVVVFPTPLAALTKNSLRRPCSHRTAAPGNAWRCAAAGTYYCWPKDLWWSPGFPIGADRSSLPWGLFSGFFAAGSFFLKRTKEYSLIS